MSAGWRYGGVLVLCFAVGGSGLLAQRHEPGGGQRRSGGIPARSGGFAGSGAPNVRSGAPPMRADAPSSGTRTGRLRGGLQLGPPGRWWDDSGFAKTLGLRKEQRQRMDTVFNANKGAILESFRALQAQESRLEAATLETNLDEARIFACIDAVNQARSALEKANAHMLLLVRQEMEPEQIDRMGKVKDPAADE